MQITKVELKNIKNHAEAEWNFGPGVVAICGPNGAGKTTILEAIAWALFDHLDYNRDDFVKRGTKRGQVAISFVSNLDQREYVVHRDTGGGYFVYDPVTRTRLIEQKNQVVPWLQQHIGVEPGTELSALFKSTIGVPQGTFTYDFTLAPTKRKMIFDQILKVEEYRQASDNLRDTLRHIESRLTEADRRLAEVEGELKTYEETQARYEETAARLRSLEAEQRTAEVERERVAREAAELDQIQKQTETQRGAVERLRMKLEITRATLTSAREAAEQARAAAAIVEAARAGHENYLAASRRLAELEKQREMRDSLRAQAAKVERELIEARVKGERSKERLTEVAQARDELAGLATKINEQGVIEARLATLREGRGEAQSLQRTQAALDRELEKLRQRYSKLSRQVEAADAQREQAQRVESLEAERKRLDEEIAQKELSLNNYRVKREHLENLRSELKRLVTESEKYKREAARLGPLADSAAKLVEIEARQQSETERLAKLRAEVARDAEMIAGLESGGICPLLTEKCLNLKAGESLDGRFRSGLDARRNEIEQLTSAITALGIEVKNTRTAAVEAAHLPKLREEAERVARELTTQQAKVTSLEEETALGSSVTDDEIKALKDQRPKIEGKLREAREAQKLYSQAEVLRREMTEVKSEGETKKREREEITARLTKLGDIEAQLAATEEELRALNDPRGRATALDQIIKREDEWQREAKKAERTASEITASLEKLNAELLAYGLLDADISAAQATRAASERDYHSFIAHEKIAATVAARENEVVAVTAEIEQTETSLAATQVELRALEARYDAERHHRVQSELIQWRERTAQITTQLEHAREEFSRLQTQLDHLNAVRDLRREQLAAKERTLRLRETADFIRDILQKAAPFITESYLFSISIEANQLFRDITGRYDVTLRWNTDYEITLEEEGRDRPFANLSGGEQMAAALAVRLALLKELSEVNLAFFDEPTTNMDEERRRNLAQQIGRIKDFQQLFVISHDDSFEGYTDQIITLGNGS